MSKSALPFDPNEYATVAERIALFYDRYPEGRIITELVSRENNEIMFKALVFRGPAEIEPSSTGWASERQGVGEINQVACLENTETSAVGRALANLGFTGSKNRASYEEMIKANRARHRVVRERFNVSSGTSAEPPVAQSAKAGSGISDSPLQRAADILTDTMELLNEAERAGMGSTRIDELRNKLRSSSSEITLPYLEHVQARLRRWLADQDKRDSAAERTPLIQK